MSQIPPTALDDKITILQTLGMASINVLVNDTYLPGPPETLTIVAKTNGAHGTVNITGGGTGITYTPAKWVGTDTFTYTIMDGDGLTATATVTVTVFLYGDANGDCTVNVVVYLLVAGDNWQADINGDKKINVVDLIAVRNKLATKCLTW